MGKPITKELIKRSLYSGKYDLIAITCNKISTGVMNPIEEIAEAVKNYPEIIFLFRFS